MERKSKFKQLDVVVVEWRDAYFDFDQMHNFSERDDYIVSTVGFLLSDGPIFIIVVQEILPDNDGYRGITHIPWETVITINGNKPKSKRLFEATEQD